MINGFLKHYQDKYANSLAAISFSPIEDYRFGFIEQTYNLVEA